MYLQNYFVYKYEAVSYTDHLLDCQFSMWETEVVVENQHTESLGTEGA